MQPALFRPRSLWLVLPPILLCCLDFGLTLYGQSDAYWRGDYQDLRELSPSFGRYLAIHPLAFVTAALAWIGIFVTLIAILPEKAGLTLSVCVVLGHMTGAASWLAYGFESYQACNALFLGTAVILVSSFRLGHSDTGETLIDWSRTPVPAAARWGLALILSAVPIWWFLIPH